jgi:hypothetical protein
MQSHFNLGLGVGVREGEGFRFSQHPSEFSEGG